MKKSERDHLRHNDLVDFLTEMSQAIRPHLTLILASVVLVLIGYIAWSVNGEWNRAEQESAWAALDEALRQGGLDSAALETVATHYDRTYVGNRALVLAGNLRLSAGTEEVFSNKENAATDLQKAIDLFTAVLDRSRDAAPRQEALLGIGRAYETLAAIRDPDQALAEARANYQTLVDKYPDGFFRALAQQRLAELKRPSTEAFYESMVAWTPDTRGMDGAAGHSLDFDFLGGDGDIGDLLNASGLDFGGSGLAPNTGTGLESFLPPLNGDDSTLPVAPAMTSPDATEPGEQPAEPLTDEQNDPSSDVDESVAP